MPLCQSGKHRYRSLYLRASRSKDRLRTFVSVGLVCMRCERYLIQQPLPENVR